MRLPHFAGLLMVSAFIFMALLTGCSEPVEKGVLTGHVTIGSLCASEQCGSEQRAQAYDARKLIVSQGLSSQLITIDADGNYRAELAPGQYLIDLRGIGLDMSPQLPKTILIDSGRTTRVNINIEKGLG